MFATGPAISMSSTNTVISKGFMYLSILGWFTILLAFPLWRRFCAPFGLLVLCASLVASSFATTVTQLLWTQGVLYAVGGCALYAPTVLYLDEWFVRKKGLAFGIMW